MASFTRSDDLQGAEFIDANLRGARFVGADLSAVVMRGVEMQRAEIDSPWLFEGENFLRVNGVDVLPFLDRAGAMPAGTVDVSVDGEWSFAQTLRHLVLATDTWLGRAILKVEQPYHRLGLVDTGTVEDGRDMSVFTTDIPSYEDVLEARASRVAMVRDFLATVTQDELAATRRNPHAAEHPETVLSCLRTILQEEWEHNRYAVRDLDAIEAMSGE